MEQPSLSFANYPLKDIPGPHPHDVLCGRGGGTNNHVGNSHWRMLVAANKQLYVTLPKRQKMLLSRSIVNAVRSQNPPGRFLQKDAKSELWYDVGDQRAQEKTSQALREGAPDIRSKMAKGDTNSTETSTKSNTTAPKTQSSKLPAPKSATVSAPTQAATLPSPGLITSPHGATFVAAQTGEVGSSGTIQVPVPPPGATPVVVYAMPQGMPTMPGMQMYPAMMTPQGTILTPMHAMAPPFPAPVPPQIPSQKSGGTNGLSNRSDAPGSMPPPSVPAPPHTISSHSVENYPGKMEGRETVRFSDETAAEIAARRGNSNYDKTRSTDDFADGVAMVESGLEPSGISFGSYSMASVDTKKLETAGTSFGSMMSTMSFTTMASGRAPDMVDGGLEPIGTSFGSLSLNSVDRSNLQRALQPDQSMGSKAAATTSYETPTLLSQQRSTGNLLECSDTDSDEEEEDHSPNQASKSAEWEKLKAMLDVHTTMESKREAKMTTITTPTTQPTFEALPHTGFDRDFSNISALSMGEFEDFDQLSHPDEGRQHGQLSGPGGHGAAVMPPPPAMRPRESDGDSESERERLELMYLAQGGGLNL